MQSFQIIPRRRSQVFQPNSRIDQQELCSGTALDLHGQVANGMTGEYSRSALVSKALDHIRNLRQYVLSSVLTPTSGYTSVFCTDVRP